MDRLSPVLDNHTLAIQCARPRMRGPIVRHLSGEWKTAVASLTIGETVASAHQSAVAAKFAAPLELQSAQEFVATIHRQEPLHPFPARLLQGPVRWVGG